jgi:hypothetical protein
VQPQASRSTRFVSGGDPDPGIFVKVVVREWRDADLIYRAWRGVRRGGRPVRQGTPPHEVEHEALMSMLAREAGVRAPTGSTAARWPSFLATRSMTAWPGTCGGRWRRCIAAGSPTRT